MDFGLSAEQEELRLRARSAAEEVVLPGASDERFDLGAVRELGRRGPLAIDLGEIASAIIAIELGRVDSSARGFVTVQTGLVGKCIADWGSDEQKRKWLPGLATGDMVGCYALTEPAARSDAKSIASRADRKGREWRLYGEKHWITNGGVADVAIVFAIAEAGLSAFLVDATEAGLSRLPMPGRELGHRNSSHARLIFEDCRATDVLGAPGDGFKIAMSALDHGRLGVAAGAVGVLQGCLEASTEWARTRVQFGKRIGDFEMVQADLADMAADETAARALVMEAAWFADVGQDSRRAVAFAKLFCHRGRAARCGEGRRAARGSRIVERVPGRTSLQRHHGMRIYEGTSHVQRMIIARDLLRRTPKTEVVPTTPQK